MQDQNSFPQLDESARKTNPLWHKRDDGGLFQQPAKRSLGTPSVSRQTCGSYNRAETIWYRRLDAMELCSHY